MCTTKLSEVPHLEEHFDCFYSWSVFEHIDEKFLDQIVRGLKDLLKPGGFKFLQICGMLYSAYGSHLQECVSTPWAHLLMQHNNLRMKVLGVQTLQNNTTDDDIDSY